MKRFYPILSIITAILGVVHPGFAVPTTMQETLIAVAGLVTSAHVHGFNETKLDQTIIERIVKAYRDLEGK